MNGLPDINPIGRQTAHPGAVMDGRIWLEGGRGGEDGGQGGAGVGQEIDQSGVRSCSGIFQRCDLRRLSD